MGKKQIPIKVISLDFDGVFPMGKRKYNYEESLFKNLKKKSRHINKKEIYDLFENFIKHDRNERLFHKSGKLIPYIQNYLKSKKINNIEANEIVLDALLDKNTIYPLTKKLKSFFKFIVNNNIKIALVSDTIFPTIMRRIILQKWGLLQYFDVVLTSQEHDRKNGLKIFKIMINYFNVKPGEILHVGNELSNDITPAKKAGIQTCLILNSNKNDIIKTKIYPDFTIKNLQELKKLIQN